jgi:hypothetical protein
MYVQQTSTLNATNVTLVPAALQQQNQFSSVITDITNLVTAVDGNITFNDNMAGVFVTFTTTTANVSNSVPHTLGSIPIGFIVTNINVGGVVYAPSTLNWTSTKIQLYCSTANATVTAWLIAGG